MIELIDHTLWPIGEVRLQKFEFIVGITTQPRDTFRPVSPELPLRRGQRIDCPLDLQRLGDSTEQHNAGQSESHQRQAMTEQRPIMQRDIGVAAMQLQQFSIRL
ncbi:hypothetical protein D3C72_1989300 [compost metagenome]